MRSAISLLVVIVALILTATSAQSLSPAIAVGATGAGIKKIGNAVIPAIMDSIREADFEGASGKESGYKYSISNVHMNKLKYQDFILEANKNGFIGGIRGLTVSVGLKWSYKKSKFPWVPFGSGKADISLTDCTIDGQFSFARKKVNGKDLLAVSVSNVKVKIAKVSIKTHGSLFSWLYNLISSLLSKKIRQGVEASIKAGFEAAVNQRMVEMLKTMDPLRPVADWGVIDLSLPRDPAYYTNSRGAAWTFNFNGEVYPATTKAPLNVVKRPSMPWTTVNRDFELNFSLFTLNSAAAVWHRTRPWSGITTNAKRPQGFPVALTANAWQPHVPGVQASFAGQELQIETSLLEFPTATTNGNEVVLKTAYLIKVTSNKKLVFSVRALGTGAITFSTRPTAIVPRINDMTGLFNVVDTSIGPINLKAAEFIFNAVLKLVAVPAINEQLFVGFPLPTINGLSFNSPSINVRDGFITVGLNADYKP